MREWGWKSEAGENVWILFRKGEELFFFFKQHVAVLVDCSFIFLNKSLLFLFFLFFFGTYKSSL